MCPHPAPTALQNARAPTWVRSGSRVEDSKNRGFIFLKQTIPLPGITRVQTTMISIGRARNLAFKQAQRLPTLSSELPVNTAAKPAENFWPTTKLSPAPRSDAGATQLTRLPLPSASEPLAERVGFALVALSAAVGTAQALLPLVSTASGWPLFGTWLGVMLN